MSQEIDEDEDIVLAELDDDELVEQMFDAFYDGLAGEIAEGTQILLDRGWDARKIVDEALVAEMNIVGMLLEGAGIEVIDLGINIDALCG